MKSTVCTLQASLSGTFLQTLPELVTYNATVPAQLSTDAVSALQTLPELVTYNATVSAQLSTDAVSALQKV